MIAYGGGMATSDRGIQTLHCSCCGKNLAHKVGKEKMNSMM